MEWVKKVLGLLCILVGIVPPYVMYAISEDGNLRNPILFWMMLAAAVTSFVIFAISRFLFSTIAKRVIIGTIASYVAFLFLLLVEAVIHGGIAETLMWMPVILLFGISFMAPLVGMAWFGSILVVGNEKKGPS